MRSHFILSNCTASFSIEGISKVSYELVTRQSFVYNANYAVLRHLFSLPLKAFMNHYGLSVFVIQQMRCHRTVTPLTIWLNDCELIPAEYQASTEINTYSAVALFSTHKLSSSHRRERHSKLIPPGLGNP